MTRVLNETCPMCDHNPAWCLAGLLACAMSGALVAMVLSWAF